MAAGRRSHDFPTSLTACRTAANPSPYCGQMYAAYEQAGGDRPTIGKGNPVFVADAGQRNLRAKTARPATELSDRREQIL
jgi:hypothetical protein